MFRLLLVLFFFIDCLPPGKGSQGKGILIPNSGTAILTSPGQLIVSPRSNIILSESGTASFTIKLNKEPTSSVHITSILLSGTTLAKLSQGNTVISPSNWNSPNTITIEGIPNDTIEGNQNFIVSLGNTSSQDSEFDKLVGDQVTGEVIDDDVFGITVTPTSGLTTSNAGSGTSFNVVMNKKEIAPFTISVPISISVPNIVNLSSSMLYFTDSNWNIPQTVNVTGIISTNSFVDQPYTITVGPTSSSEANLNGFSSTISLTHMDSDTSHFDITPTSGLVTTKAGGSGIIHFRLTSQPSANLQISVSSSNATQGTVTPSLLVFTTSNWNIYKTVTVTGVNNNLIEGNRDYSIDFGSVVGGGVLAGKKPNSISIKNQDTNMAGILLSSTSLSLNEGSTGISVTAKLSTVPTANVIVHLSSSDTLTGGTVSPSTLVFNSTNWNIPQNIIITPVPRDNIQTANVNYAINITTTSSDFNYSGITTGPIHATTINVDTRGYAFSQTNNFYLTGSGSNASFTIKLNTIPLGGNVIIPIKSLSGKITVSPNSLNFTSANWNNPQTITVKGIDDGTFGVSIGQIQVGSSFSPFYPYAGNSDYFLKNVSIGDYNGANQGNIDFQFTGIGGGAAKMITVIPPVNSLQAIEGGSGFNYYLNLSQSPNNIVYAPLSVSDTSRSVITSSISLNSNYNQFLPSNKVTVTAIHDNLITGNKNITIQHGSLSSSDIFFDEYDPRSQDFSINIVDVDTFGFQRNQLAGIANIVTEYSGANNVITYQIRLNAKPNLGEICSFNLSSSDSTAATVYPASMTFTNSDWNVYQYFTVTGVSNSTLNVNRSFTINFSNTYSGQLQFNNHTISPIGASVLSNAIIISNPVPSNQTSVSGMNASFTVVLNSPPTANVNISSITSSNTQAGKVFPSSLSFTTANWNIPQTVTVLGLNPSTIQNGTLTYQINFSNSLSTDTKYNAVAIPPILMQHLDY